MNSFSKLTARTAAAVLSVLVLSSTSAARTPDEVRAACRAEGRPCVGLVLSGGGARGFAHVGVLEELERLGVKIDVIAGTSMGSMIGGAYAAGYTPKEVEGIVLGVDWDRMLAPRLTRSELPRRIKEDDYLGLSSGGIMLDGKGRARLPEGIVPSQELSIFLQSNTDRVSMVRDLSRLPVPFAALATDLVTGERVVMSEDCNLGEAMRASMSVPGAFEPFAHKGRLLVDGGLVDNLPVGLAREMGADVVIAVNVGTPLYKRDELRSVVGVMAQMVNLLTEQNVRTSLASLGEHDILITPDLEGFSSADLKKSAEIIQRGREAAKHHENALAQLASSKKDYVAWDLARREIILDAVEHPTHTLTAVRVEGRTRLAPERIIASADIPVGEPVSTAEIEEGTRRVWSQGYFERVAYRFEPGPNGTEVLVLEPRERRENYATIRLGGSIETDFCGGSNFDVVGSYTWHLVNTWGAEWKTEVQVGEEQRVATEFYQPLGASSSLFVTPSIELYRSAYDVWENGSAVASAHDTVLDVRLEIGSEFGRLGAVSGFTGWLEQESSSDVGRRPRGEESYRSPYVGAALNLDTLDSINFPTSGMRLSLQGYVTEGNAGDSGKGHHYLGSLTLPYAWGPWVVATTLEAGESTRRSTFRLGGARQMIGSDYGRWVGSRMQYGRIGLARNMSEMLDWSAFPIWFGATVEAGRAWDPSAPEGTESANDTWRKAASVYAGVDSPFGPVFITFGRTFGEGTAVYFSWGHRQ